MWQSNPESKSNIVLIGFMGSGKSSVGALLAHLRNMRFLDTDTIIESTYGESIRSIFAGAGEQVFRDRETECLHKCLQESNNNQSEPVIISTGGGIILRAENRELLTRLGMVVYLFCSPESVKARLNGDMKRPLARDEEKLQKIYQERLPLYQMIAQQTVCTDHRDITDVTQEILHLYDNRSQ